MTDAIERLKELCSNQIADPSTAPEFVFLDPDLPVSEWEKQYSMDVVYVRADRIEQLVAELDLMKTAGIIEIASRNNRVTEYMFHWEGRALDAEAKLAKAVEALVVEREVNLWNAYNIGIERDGRWSDGCMYDAEWLVEQCGLDPEFKDHDANVIKETIHTAARKVLAQLEGEE